MKNRIWLIISVSLISFAFLYFVWPTPYIYRKYNNWLIRINRITQKVYILTSSGWEPMFQDEKKNKKKNDIKIIEEKVIDKVISDPIIKDVIANEKYTNYIRQRLDFFLPLIIPEWPYLSPKEKEKIFNSLIDYPVNFVRLLFETKGYWFLEAKDPIEEAYYLVTFIYVPFDYSNKLPKQGIK